MQKTEVLSPDVTELAGELGIGESIYSIIDITREMFPGLVVAHVIVDPEWPEDRAIVFDVEATGEPRDITELQIEWNRRIQVLIPTRLDVVALCIMPR